MARWFTPWTCFDLLFTPRRVGFLDPIIISQIALVDLLHWLKREWMTEWLALGSVKLYFHFKSFRIVHLFICRLNGGFSILFCTNSLEPFAINFHSLSDNIIVKLMIENDCKHRSRSISGNFFPFQKKEKLGKKLRTTKDQDYTLLLTLDLSFTKVPFLISSRPVPASSLVSNSCSSVGVFPLKVRDI